MTFLVAFVLCGLLGMPRRVGAGRFEAILADKEADKMMLSHGKCGDVHQAIVEKGVRLEDPEFGPESPFVFLPLFQSKNACKFSFKREKDQLGCPSPFQCATQIKADMKIQCARASRVTDNGLKVACHAFQPRSLLYGEDKGFKLYSDSSYYKAVCACDVVGTLTVDPPSCSAISNIVSSEAASDVTWETLAQSTTTCKVSGFVERLTAREEYSKLSDEIKSMASPANLEVESIPAGAESELARILLTFCLPDELRKWAKGKGAFAGKTIADLQRLDENAIKDYFHGEMEKEEDIEASEETLLFYAKKVLPIVQSIEKDEDVQQAKKAIEGLKFNEDVRVVGPQSDQRMTRELCVEAMKVYGCHEDLVDFVEGGEATQYGRLSTDDCRCDFAAA